MGGAYGGRRHSIHGLRRAPPPRRRRRTLLPDRVGRPRMSPLAALAALTAGTLFGASPTPLLRAVLAAAGLSVFYLVLVLLPGTGLGAGDAKLAAPIGLCLGYLSTGAVVVATITGTLLAAAYVVV